MAEDTRPAADSPVSWLPIRYLGFHDVPRAFVVEHAGAAYLFDCPFDDAPDEYPPHYRVYRLLPSAPLDADDWTGLASHGRFIGRIGVAQVRFDEMRRKAVDASVLRALTPQPSA